LGETSKILSTAHVRGNKKVKEMGGRSIKNGGLRCRTSLGTEWYSENHGTAENLTVLRSGRGVRKLGTDANAWTKQRDPSAGKFARKKKTLAAGAKQERGKQSSVKKEKNNFAEIRDHSKGQAEKKKTNKGLLLELQKQGDEYHKGPNRTIGGSANYDKRRVRLTTNGMNS